LKKTKVIATLLFGLFFLTAQVHAVPQVGGPEIKQKVSKTAKRATTQAKVRYQWAPQFAPIEGTLINCATNTPQPVRDMGDAFYLAFTYYNPIVRSTPPSARLHSKEFHGGPLEPVDCVHEPTDRKFSGKGKKNNQHFVLLS
jgi:hypothetical protein